MISKNKCIIIGSGCFDEKITNIGSDDVVLCADGGYNYALKYNIKVDAIIGDNDSILHEPNNIKILAYKTDKDFTDMHLALNYGRNLGYKNFELYGAYGDRPDHFLANLQLLSSCALNNENAVIIDKRFSVFSLHKARIIFNKTSKNKVVSVFSLLNESTMVSTTGLKFNLNNAILNNTFALGVSNMFLGNLATITVDCGCILILSYDTTANNNYLIKRL